MSSETLTGNRRGRSIASQGADDEARRIAVNVARLPQPPGGVSET
jgi:hypothetical protein